MKRIYEYKDLQPELDRLLQEKESSDIEFKSAKGGFPHSFWETYSSFANTDGGAIIFGIKEKDDQFFLDGLTKEQVRKYEKDFFDRMHSKESVSTPLLREDDVQAVKLDGVYFLFFYIPRVDRSLRPVYCGLDPYTGTYRRDIEGDYHCSREEVNSMFADANLASPVDGRILKNFSKEDLDADSIKQYRRRFEQWNPDHVWNSLSEDKFLEKLNVFRKDRKTGEYGLTYAGLLMFGTYSAIMDENPNFFPDYQEIQDPKDRWINRICPDGNWESNLFQFGIMLISMKQYYQGGESICRNKYLQTMFTFLGSAEKAGSGVDKIIRGWEELNWKRPYLVEKKRPNKVVLTLSMESLLDESVKEGLSRIFGEKIVGIPKEQLLTLALAYSEEEITNEGLQYALNMHKADITAMLAKMCSAHLLESSGRGRGTKYHVYGLKAGLPEANVGLNMGLPEANVGLNMGLPEANMGLNIGLQKRRYSKEEMRKLIVDYCCDWRTVEEIAFFVNKKVRYIRDIVLPQLSDIIEKKYDVPHHPKQKYRAKQKEADA